MLPREFLKALNPDVAKSLAGGIEGAIKRVEIRW